MDCDHFDQDNDGNDDVNRSDADESSPSSNTTSPKKREELTSILGKALSKPIVVRWNSLFDSLELILSLRERILQSSTNLGIANPMRDSDFKYLEEFTNCLRPLIETINKLQGERYCTYGYLLPCLVSLRQKFLNIGAKGELNHCQSLIDALVISLETRFHDFFEIEGNGYWAAIAAIIHPHFKTQWICCLSITAQNKVYSALMAAAQTESSTHTCTTLRPSSVDSFFDFGNGRSSTTEITPEFDNSDGQMEVGRYLQEPVTNNLSAITVYPTVKKLFIKYNTPLPSSAPVERLFSYATMHNLPRSNRLTPEKF